MDRKTIRRYARSAVLAANAPMVATGPVAIAGEMPHPGHRELQTVADPAHSATEERFFALGQRDAGRLLLVVFTLRGALIRVISARPMSRREREVYADAQAEERSE